MFIKLLRVILPVILIVVLVVFLVPQFIGTSPEPQPPADNTTDEPFPDNTASAETGENAETDASAESDATTTIDDFYAQQTAKEQRVAAALDKLSSTLTKDQLHYLQVAQSDWQEYYESFAGVLKVQLDTPIMIQSDSDDVEREVNIYRDTILIILGERADDLENWAEQNYRLVEADQVAGLKMQIRAEKSDLAFTFSMNIVYLDEGFRKSWQEAQNSWYDFLASNNIFISAATRSNGAAMVAEELFQIERMSSLAALHQKGILHFRNEKEE